MPKIPIEHNGLSEVFSHLEIYFTRQFDKGKFIVRWDAKMRMWELLNAERATLLWAPQLPDLLGVIHGTRRITVGPL